jgi:hypothetical protein
VGGKGKKGKKKKKKRYASDEKKQRAFLAISLKLEKDTHLTSTSPL